MASLRLAWSTERDLVSKPNLSIGIQVCFTAGRAPCGIVTLAVTLLASDLSQLPSGVAHTPRQVVATLVPPGRDFGVAPKPRHSVIPMTLLSQVPSSHFCCSVRTGSGTVAVVLAPVT